MSDNYPVTVEVRRPDGGVEQVRVGTATKGANGFQVTFFPMSISTTGEPVAAAPRAARSSGAGGGGGGGDEPTVFPPYGRAKGMPIRGASQNDLEFYANGSRRSLADPSKSRWHDKERVMLAAIEAELARQRGGEPPADDGIPPPGDEDAPF